MPPISLIVENYNPKFKLSNYIRPYAATNYVAYVSYIDRLIGNQLVYCPITIPLTSCILAFMSTT